MCKGRGRSKGRCVGVAVWGELGSERGPGRAGLVLASAPKVWLVAFALKRFASSGKEMK